MKPYDLRVQLGQFGPRQAERIDGGDQMPADAIGPHQLIDAILQQSDFDRLGLGFGDVRIRKRCRSTSLTTGGSIGCGGAVRQ